MWECIANWAICCEKRKIRDENHTTISLVYANSEQILIEFNEMQPVTQFPSSKKNHEAILEFDEKKSVENFQWIGYFSVECGTVKYNKRV